MDDDPRLSPLIDDESRQLIEVRQYLASKPVEEALAVPWALLFDPRLKPHDTRLYSLFVYLALGKGGSPFPLPPQKDLALILGWSLGTLGASEKRLHRAGWISITNLEKKGKKERFRVIVNYLESSFRMVKSEVLEALEGFLGKRIEELVKAQLDIILIPSTCTTSQADLQVPPRITKLLKESHLTDETGLSLRELVDRVQLLLEWSQNASWDDIELGIRNCNNFQKGKKRRSLAATFRDCFDYDETLGRGVFKAEYRSGLTRKGGKSMPVNGYWTTREIDELHEALNRGEWTDVWRFPKGTKERYWTMGILEAHKAEKMYRLKEVGFFQKSSSGLWEFYSYRDHVHQAQKIENS